MQPASAPIVVNDPVGTAESDSSQGVEHDKEEDMDLLAALRRQVCFSVPLLLFRFFSPLLLRMLQPLPNLHAMSSSFDC